MKKNGGTLGLAGNEVISIYDVYKLNVYWQFLLPRLLVGVHTYTGNITIRLYWLDYNLQDYSSLHSVCTGRSL